MDYFFNELSQELMNTRQQVYGLMEKFITAAVEAEKSLSLNTLRIDEELGENLYNLFLMKDYNIGSWIDDNRVDKDIKDKFLTIISSSPLIEKEEKERFDFEVCNYNNKEARGLKAALFYNSFCINLLTNDCWDTTSLSITHEYINDDQLVSSDKIIKSFATTLHVKDHIAWFQAFQKENLKTSKELWIKKNDFFPYLTMCDNIRKSITRMGKSTNLHIVIEKLRVMNKIAQNWDKGSFNYQEINKNYNITIHPESQQTLDNYSACRCFSLPNGIRKTFSLHILAGDLRIYFYPDNDTKHIYIGYIGPHLPTMLY